MHLSTAHHRIKQFLLRKPTVYLLALLLLLATLAVFALTRSNSDQPEAHNGGISRLFSSAEDTLQQRVQKLEVALQESNRIQSELLDLVGELHNKLETNGGATVQARSLELRRRPRQRNGAQNEQASRTERHRQYREIQMQRLLDAGLSQNRVEFILDKQERFQYDYMRYSYEYRHLQDKSSERGAELKEQLEIHSNPRRLMEHELSKQEFDLYLEANGERQEMRIDRVVSETPAASIGLQPGDKIISYNGERVFHMGDLRSQIYKVAPGETVQLEVEREGGNREVLYVPSGPLGIQG